VSFLLDYLPNASAQRALTNAMINRHLSAASAVLTFAVKAEYREGKPETPLLDTRVRGALLSRRGAKVVLRRLTRHRTRN